MLSPVELKLLHPGSPAAQQTVAEAREAIRRILAGDDPRRMLIAGPCSIHDPEAALDYARRLKRLADAVSDELLVVMRMYFEKPRTTVGWRGFIGDPGLDGSHDLEAGLSSARQLLVEVNELGLPCATESLDPMLVRHTEDLVAWTALGARTSESQIHRAMASGLPMAVGIKNSTNGGVGVAIDGVATVMEPQSYLAVTDCGRVGPALSSGNPLAHVVLRGGSTGPNFDAESVAGCEAELVRRGLPPNVVIDCSHANSAKDPFRQPEVLDVIGRQVAQGNRSIVGVMLESFIEDGNQPIDSKPLRYGVSVTDGCIGWDRTEEAVLRFRETLASAGRCEAVVAA